MVASTAVGCRGHASRFLERREVDVLMAVTPESRAGDAALVDALRRLAPRERAAIHLRYFEDRSFAETAATLGVRENSARVIVHRALAKLRHAMASSVSARGVEA